LMWRTIWRNLRINQATRKTNQLSWKIIHNTVYTEAKLQKMGRSMNGLCQVYFVCRIFYRFPVI
jgi:hypothetical protein